MASNVIITSVIIAVFLVGLAQKGLSLSCYICYSTISWEDCFNTSTVRNCKSGAVACVNTFTAVKQKDDRQKFQFTAYCDFKDSCDKEKCRKEVARRGEYKAVNCKVSCCETDQCNMAVVSKGQVSSISILGLIISLLSCYSFQNYKLMSFQNY
ncbi:uncharacterized protein [Pocillopora verrucosa]|uniref:uncharacterized protein isoform X1 n=1 Tax=Pocillopora verrucosa TaxID=203993 RepID=UPI0033418E97